MYEVITVLLMLYIGVLNAADTGVDIVVRRLKERPKWFREYQVDIVVRRLKKHSTWFRECPEATNGSDIQVYDSIMETSHMNLKPIMHILETAENDKQEALNASCNVYVQGLQGDKGNRLIELLKAANYLDIPCISECCAEYIATDYNKVGGLKQFVDNPEIYEDKINSELAPELQHKIINYLLQEHKKRLLEPQQLHRCTAHTGPILAVVFNHDCSQLASGSEDNTVRIWNPATGQQLKCIGHTGPVLTVVFNHDGSRLASGSYDRIVRIWNPTTGQLLHRYNASIGPIFAVAFNHDGSQLASGSWDNTVCIWDSETDQQLHRCTGHTGSVNTVAFNHDGSQLASGSWDNTVCIWNSATGQQLYRYTGHTGSVNTVAFNHDGSRLASGSDDETVCIWDIPQYPVLTQSLDLVQALYVCTKLSKHSYAAEGQYFKELHDSLPAIIKRILDKDSRDGCRACTIL